MGYTKLWSDIVRSSLLECELHVRYVFLMMLAMKRLDGIVYGTRAALARAVNLTPDQTNEALDALCSPDPNSSSKRDEGRRLREVSPNRWLVINADDYRGMIDDTDSLERGRVRTSRYRAKKLAAQELRDTDEGARVTLVTLPSQVTFGDGEASPSPSPEKTGRASGADAPSSRSRKRVSYPDDFETWFVTYRKATGRGTTKAEALTEYLKATDEDRGALEQCTLDWLSRRNVAKAAGVFVPEAPDPVRFLKHRRWEDEFDTPSETEPPRLDPIRDSYKAQFAAEGKL